MGGDLVALLQNINHLHYNLERSFRESTFPVFEVAGTNNRDFVLSYQSSRGVLLAPLVEGLLPTLGRALYDQSLVRMERWETPKKGGFHATWTIRVEKRTVAGLQTLIDNHRHRHHQLPRRRRVSGWSCCSSNVVASQIPTGQRLSNEAENDMSPDKDEISCEDEDADNDEGSYENEDSDVDEDSSTSKQQHQRHHKLRCRRVSGWLCCSSSDAVMVQAPAKQRISQADQDEGSRTRMIETSTPKTSSSSSSSSKLTELVCVEAITPRTKSALDKLAAAVREADDPTDLLMRAVAAERVAADWFDADAMGRTSVFWTKNRGHTTDYKMSHPAKRATRFVSHSWSPPEDWDMFMSSAYSDIKASELAIAAQDITAAASLPKTTTKNPCWKKDCTFWIDKCCIPQNHPLMIDCVDNLELFLRRCDGMVVLLSWNYFNRTWCVYEWAEFLVSHHPRTVHMCVEAFLNPATLALYISSIEFLSVEKTQCQYETDREILRTKIESYYKSVHEFENFVKITAISIIAKSAARKASRGSYSHEFQPWVDLARRLNFCALASALDAAQPAAWRTTALDATTSAATQGNHGWQVAFNERVDAWFEVHVCPILEAQKGSAIAHSLSRPNLLDVKKH
ncbi:hypothetical protein CTAYLR_010776 [Chrysophaeum taylorii]|uniref:Heme NO-binding domain-containing protein n=1 Tax=Chrysophaeum taylorii TaxID=2483200 RepID=A0AAD7U5M0_9STRA|nr:hypothetical protein CTAYLR_010776 [Chrysophaeum taylorii]